MKEETNVARSFREKWENNPDIAFSQTLNEESSIFKWILERNGFNNADQFKLFLADKKRILDAGCGNGRVTALIQKYANPESQILGIDLVSSPVAEKNLKNYPNVKINKADLLNKLEEFGSFDFIYCQEVLHHTSDPQKAFKNLCNLLNKNGEIAIYVYKKKAPVREYVDDYVRDIISPLSYEEAMNICNQITEFGKVLSEQKISIRIPDLDVLEIKGGDYDLQRFIYHFFMKCFWNPEMSFSDNSVINYDWYHPQVCSRYTVPEIVPWFNNEGLQIVQENVDFYGITIRGKRL